MSRMKNFTLLIIILFAVECDSDVQRFEIFRSCDSNIDTIDLRVSAYTKDLFFSVCAKNYKAIRACQVTRDTPVTPPSQYTSKTCFFNVSYATENYDVHALKPLNGSYVLFMKGSFQGTKRVGDTYYIIRMTDCHVVTVSVPDADSSLIDAVQWTDKADFIDILYPDTKNGLADYTQIWRQRFRIDGKLLRGPKLHLKIPNFNPIHTDCFQFSSRLIRFKSIYYGTKNEQHEKSRENYIKISRIDCNGKLIQVFSGRWIEFFSTSNSKLSFCEFLGSSEICCRQFDSANNDKLLMEMKFNAYKYTKSTQEYLREYNVITHNQLEGGLIIMIIAFQGKDKHSIIDHISVVRVTVDGKMSTSTELVYRIPEFSGLSSFEISDDSREVCFKLVSEQSRNGHNDMQMYKLECISKNTFVFS